MAHFFVNLHQTNLPLYSLATFGSMVLAGSLLGGLATASLRLAGIRGEAVKREER